MLYSKKLSQFKEITHGFTTRQEGNAQTWLAQNPAIAQNCVLANQIHEDNITLVGIQDKGKTIKETDGLVTGDSSVVLGVKTADCVPMLFFEPNKKIVGACHAGWKGTLLRICQKMVKKVEKAGGRRENLIAVIGPHIGMCHYDVTEERAQIFTQEFGDDPRIVSSFSDGPHLDLGFVNYIQLRELGIRRENIEAPPFCTYCDKERFFSYRRSKKEGDKFGEMLAFIELKDNKEVAGSPQIL